MGQHVSLVIPTATVVLQPLNVHSVMMDTIYHLLSVKNAWINVVHAQTMRYVLLA
jgi:hypothetical protein